MKHLKPFNENTEHELDPIVDDIRDMSLYLQDDGFQVLVSLIGSNMIGINISQPGGRFFEVGDVDSFLVRLKDYIESNTNLLLVSIKNSVGRDLSKLIEREKTFDCKSIDITISEYTNYRKVLLDKLKF